jgi:hypothetical protein
MMATKKVLRFPYRNTGVLGLYVASVGGLAKAGGIMKLAGSLVDQKGQVQ